MVPEDFIGFYNWIPVGTISQSNKMLRTKQNQETLSGLIQLAQASQMTSNPFEIDIPYYLNNHILPQMDIYDSKNFIKQIQPQMPGMPIEGNAQGQNPAAPDMNAPQIPEIPSSIPGTPLEGNLEAGINQIS
jgi:hypothetical protein